ncbi:hypothetical protein K435DRAFT_866001 [Dendrothele bispora CBS 962.96]|uniref:Uncharacterized protein n=1 Tax=Dendrothele bispora (strain CBS 962.96) TaxID=1314807 RepID=A0A4S8LI14_DENBC|nr:hypothetical protein K435DRAFT_866001 [Dendrothele bispora CBS 962.96]
MVLSAEDDKRLRDAANENCTTMDYATWNSVYGAVFPGEKSSSDVAFAWNTYFDELSEACDATKIGRSVTYPVMPDSPLNDTSNDSMDIDSAPVKPPQTSVPSDKVLTAAVLKDAAAASRQAEREEQMKNGNITIFYQEAGQTRKWVTSHFLTA